MNWSKTSAIIGFIVLLLVGIHAAISIHEGLTKPRCTCR